MGKTFCQRMLIIRDGKITILHVNMNDRWMWKLPPSQCDLVKSTYQCLTPENIINYVDDKSDSFNNIPTKVNLFRRGILNHNDQLCTGGCGITEDMDHLFAKCDFFSRILYLVSHWLDFVMVSHETLLDHLAHFGGLGGSSKHVH